VALDSPLSNNCAAGVAPVIAGLILRQLLSGDSAMCLAPCVQCDVHLTNLQVGRTVFEGGGVCQCRRRVAKFSCYGCNPRNIKSVSMNDC